MKLNEIATSPHDPEYRERLPATKYMRSVEKILGSKLTPEHEKAVKYGYSRNWSIGDTAKHIKKNL